MEIIIFGGFLGSGKTTVINRVIRGIAETGGTVAIVENEIGEVGIDDAVLGESEISVTPLFGGCVCCQISGSLIDAAATIQDEINPDWLVVEMTGLALMDSIREVFNQYGRPGTAVHTVSVLDISRWDLLLRALFPVLEHQLAGADIVLINKSDVAEATAEELEEISRLSGGAKLKRIAATADNLSLWSELQALLQA